MHVWIEFNHRTDLSLALNKFIDLYMSFLSIKVPNRVHQKGKLSQNIQYRFFIQVLTLDMLLQNIIQQKYNFIDWHIYFDLSFYCCVIYT